MTKTFEIMLLLLLLLLWDAMIFLCVLLLNPRLWKSDYIDNTSKLTQTWVNVRMNCL